MAEHTLSLTLESGETLSVRLLAENAPQAVAALLKRGTFSGDVVHSMWSGPTCLMGGINLDDAPLENPTTLFQPGDFVYHPEHHEIGFAYAPTQFREPTGSVYVTLLGRVEGDVTPLVRLCRTLQRTGAKKITLSPVK